MARTAEAMLKARGELVSPPPVQADLLDAAVRAGLARHDLMEIALADILTQPVLKGFLSAAGVYMAQAGVPMAEIGQFMGHSSVSTTYRHYARYSPEYLRVAATALEIGK